MKERIHYTKPSITELEVKYATDAARNGWGENCYEYINRFEDAFKNYLGVKHAISTSSCTGALHMGMAALNISLGDEVILADTNWIATAAPIEYLGATPVFVDILPDSWCIDPDKVEAAITTKTKAIIAVHLYGNLCEMERLLEIGKKYGLPIIEDSAEALGSLWDGNHTGTMGKFGTFSFHGTKTITTGEGGMFVTNDDDLYEKVMILSNHGRSQKQTKQFWPDMIGFKYKMSNIQAAIGCAQMERIEDLVYRKRKIFNFYSIRLGKISGIKMNPENKGNVNSYWMPTLVFDHETCISRDILIDAFAKENIDARVFFWPLSSLDMFDDVINNYHSWDIPERAINLPSYYDMSEGELERVVSVIEDIFTS
jgi:perosamine synthetase